MLSVKAIGEKINRRATYLGRDIGHAFNLHEQFFKNARGSRILVYHGLCERDHTRFNPIFLTKSIFEEHLKLYQKYCNVISLDDYYIGNFSDSKFNICLTFDDGYANNYKYVLPLLRKYKMPATFFITAIRHAGYDILWNDFLNIVSKYGPKNIWYKFDQYYKGRYGHYISAATGISLVEKLRAAGFDKKAEMIEMLHQLAQFKSNIAEEDYWLQMTEAQIKALSKSPLVTIGAHGYYHNDLSMISLPDAQHELAFTKQYLENIIQKPVNSFAFPYGSYTTDVIKVAKELGYTQLLATDFHDKNDEADATLRERFTVNPFISPLNQLYATIARRYE